MASGINSWNNIYSAIPDFKKYNDLLTLNKLSGALMAPLLGVILVKDTQSLLFRVCLWTAIGASAVKGALTVGAYVKEKVWAKTDGSDQLAKERKVFGILVPPTDPTIAYCQDRWNAMEDKLWNSFPYGNFIRSSEEGGEPMPKPEPYTLEKLEADCAQWMNDSLAIAKAVREDLKKWSESEQFRADEPIVNGKLLVVQPGQWRFKPYSCPWLYRGAFQLPVAYRNIFDLPNCIEELKKYRGHEAANMKFAETYPASNRQIHESWKEKFFTPGTKQYEWRLAYNKEISAILEQVGGAEKVPDTRFGNWAQLHQDGDSSFYRYADTLPT